MAEFTSKAIAEHAEVPLADDGQWEALVEHWRTRESRRAVPSEESAIYVASIGAERDPLARVAQLAEIVSLVLNQGGRVVGQEIVHRATPNARTFLGKGTAVDLAARARASGATMLVLDAELSPSQTRNLEDVAGIPICDREAIILNVLLRHARTRRAKIQVEIAQLEYLRPRIRGVGLDMDQQTGGSARARGPGETASELLARKLDTRLDALHAALRRIARSASTQRQRRGENTKRIALVGYTNAGKTSLMNALTGSDLSARDRPFETLDSTSRVLTRHGGDVVLCDTVGFIRRLPARLLASFESTLAEIVEASLLVLVVDSADPELELHLATTRAILDRIGAGDMPRLCVFNKVDRLPHAFTEEDLARWSAGDPWEVVSALAPASASRLADSLLRLVRSDESELATLVPYDAAELMALVYGHCRIVESEATSDGLRVRVHGPRAVVERLRAAESSGR